ncbi:hypothetical protein B9Z55_014517 [Caenorhabditis nigoni]|uniref:MULE transposase domain-containing protein n=1 Tax=Caenorhabditis nigoni TaxID=1611254 RepID=A0A2G5U671_9PELO|nr:hypothetical protein B9Z55_014517 [Caenorhabditis nigoni]
MATTPSPKRRQRRQVFLLNNWLMKPIVTLKRTGETLCYCYYRERAPCQASYALDETKKTIRIIEEHSGHEQDMLKFQKVLAQQALRKRANHGTCKDVIDSVRKEFGPDVSMCVGDSNAKRAMVYRARKIKEPEDLELDSGGKIEGKWAVTLDNQKFLQFDGQSSSGHRFLIFASSYCLQILAQSTIVFMDGTFDSVPNGYCQLFTLHVYLNDIVVRPVVYALLPDKMTTTYEDLFVELQKLPELQSWNPLLVICDYEAAIKTAVENKLSNAEILGCLFHLCQAWRRHAEKLKLYNEFRVGSIQQFWRLLRVLPFIEPTKIPHYFSVILATVQRPQQQSYFDFVAYLHKYYVRGTPTKPPRFPPQQWSCSTRIVNSIHRTSNICETWHKCLNEVTRKSRGLGKTKMTDLLSKLQSEDEHTSHDADELSRNPNFKVKKSRHVKNVLKDRRLKKAVENTPTPPGVPLDDLPLLQSFVHATQ